MPPIFISYSRAQRDFAEQLYADLTAQGFDVRRDLHDLKGGDAWWPQLQEMIRTSDTMVLCMSSEALTSPVVADEWHYARQVGVRVIPIVAADVDFKAAPRWMTRVDWIDFRPAAKEHELAWERFVNQLKTPYQPRKVPFMVDALPPDFVRRPDVFEPLVAALLHESTDPVAITTALRGAGGYGKTTQARAICHDPRIRARYDDGILWVTLGESVTENERISKLLDLCERLTGQRPAVTALDAAHDALRQSIGDRHLLLVIDDVWRRADADPFITAAPHSAVLITTRDRNVLPLNSQPFTVDAMQAAQAVELLAWQVAGWEGQRPAFAALAARLGEWALMLKLANGALRKRLTDGDSLPTALAWMEKALTRRGLAQVFAGDDPDSRHRSALATVSVSLDLLDEHERELYDRLAIFPEDTDIPLATLEKLWDVDDFDVEDIAQRLYGRSLLLYFDLSARLIRLHDVVRTMLRDEQKDTLPALNAAFFNSYSLFSQIGTDEVSEQDLRPLSIAMERAMSDSSEWGGEDFGLDSYLWRHIGYHLLEAGQAATLRALLFNYHWLRAKLEATDINALLADCALLNPTTDEPLRLLQQALSLSVNILKDHKDQLGGQLRGRLLLYFNTQSDIQSLIQQTETINDFLPINSGLHLAGGNLLRTLEGHTAEVLDALQLRDGHILSWSTDRTLRLWRNDGSEQHVSYMKKGVVIGGAKELDDGRVLTWSNDCNLVLWEHDGQIQAVLSGHTSPVVEVILLSNGNIVSRPGGFSDRPDYTLRLWGNDGRLISILGAATRRYESSFKPLRWLKSLLQTIFKVKEREQFISDGHTQDISGILALADDRILSWSSRDCTLRLWHTNGKLQTVLSGHTGWVEGAAVTADGRILSWSSDRTLRLWDSEGHTEAVLRGHTDSVNYAQILPNGRILSWVGDGHSTDFTLRLWASDGAELAVLSGHTQAVSGVCILTSGHILSWSQDKTLRLWNENGDAGAILSGHDSLVTNALELHNGRILSWSLDNTLRLWDTDGHTLAVLRGHSAYIRGINQLLDGRILTWSQDRTIRLWDSDGSALVILRGHTDNIRGVRILYDGNILSWGDDKTLRLWDTMSDVQATITGHTGEVNHALQLEDNRWLTWSGTSLAKNHLLCLWSASGEMLATLAGHSDWVWGALCLPDGRFLSWSNDKTLRIWSSDGQPIAILEGHTSYVKGALLLPDGRFLSHSYDHTLRLWSSDGQPIAILEGHTALVEGALLMPDGRFLSHSYDHTLRLWSSDGQPIAILEGHTALVEGALLMPDGRFLSWTGGLEAHDCTLRLWSSDCQALATFVGHTNNVEGALLMPDGRFLSWSDDSTLRFWSSDGQLISTVQGHTSYVMGTLLLSDARLLSWSADRTLRLWSPTGEPLAVFYADAPVTCATLSHDQRTVVAGDREGRVMFLRLPPA